MCSYPYSIRRTRIPRTGGTWTKGRPEKSLYGHLQGSRAMAAARRRPQNWNPTIALSDSCRMPGLDHKAPPIRRLAHALHDLRARGQPPAQHDMPLDLLRRAAKLLQTAADCCGSLTLHDDCPSEKWRKRMRQHAGGDYAAGKGSQADSRNPGLFVPTPPQQRLGQRTKRLPAQLSASPPK